MLGTAFPHDLLQRSSKQLPPKWRVVCSFVFLFEFWHFNVSLCLLDQMFHLWDRQRLLRHSATWLWNPHFTGTQPGQLPVSVPDSESPAPPCTHQSSHISKLEKQKRDSFLSFMWSNSGFIYISLRERLPAGGSLLMSASWAQKKRTCSPSCEWYLLEHAMESWKRISKIHAQPLREPWPCYPFQEGRLQMLPRDRGLSIFIFWWHTDIFRHKYPL